MWFLLADVVLAGPLPESVDLDDVLAWEGAAETLLEMPAGCWEWVGEAKWDWYVGRWGGSRGDAVFAGRTRDGTWGSVHLQPLGEQMVGEGAPLVEVYDASEARFAPLVGRFEGARVTVAGAGENQTEADLEKNAAAANVLRVALDRFMEDAYTSDTRWDESRNGVVLHRSISLAVGDRQQVDYSVFFPDGELLPSAIDVVFPKVFHTGRFPRWTIRNAEVHIRGTVNGNRVFPTSEAFTFGFGILGFKFHGAQTLRYRRVTRCDRSAPAEPVAPPPQAAQPPADPPGEDMPTAEAPAAEAPAPEAATDAPATDAPATEASAESGP
jgi:hypothetical protein